MEKRFSFSVYRVCIINAIQESAEAVDSREIIRRLKQDGWFEVAHVGSHKQFKHASKPGRVPVPPPRRDVPAGTLRSIEKQAGIRLR